MRILVLVLVLISTLSTFFLQNHWFDINPDGVSYLQIARLYQNGQFTNALNGYWSPFFSWLIAFISLFVEPFIAAKIIVFVSILLFIMLSYFVSKKISANESIAQVTAFLVATFPQLYEWLLLITPDVLFSCIVLVIFFFWYRLLNKKSFFWEWVFLGLLCGIGFLVKSFFFPFSFILISAFSLKEKTFKSWKQVGLFLLGIIIIPLLWSGLLYFKYHHFTFGTSSAFTYERFILQREYIFLKQPMSYPFPQSSFWADPTDFSAVRFDIRLQIIGFWENMVLVFTFLFRSLPFFFIALFFWILGYKSQLDRFILFVSTFWIVLYCLVRVESRYLIPIVPLLVLFTVRTIVRHSRYLLLSLIIVQLFLFGLAFVKHLPLNSVGRIHFQIATNIPENCVLISDDWARGLAVSYFAKCSYLGKMGNDGKTLNATHFVSFENSMVQLFSL